MDKPFHAKMILRADLNIKVPVYRFATEKSKPISGQGETAGAVLRSSATLAEHVVNWTLCPEERR